MQSQQITRSQLLFMVGKPDVVYYMNEGTNHIQWMWDEEAQDFTLISGGLQIDPVLGLNATPDAIVALKDTLARLVPAKDTDDPAGQGSTYSVASARIKSGPMLLSTCNSDSSTLIPADPSSDCC